MNTHKSMHAHTRQGCRPQLNLLMNAKKQEKQEKMGRKDALRDRPTKEGSTISLTLTLLSLVNPDASLLSKPFTSTTTDEITAGLLWSSCYQSVCKCHVVYLIEPCIKQDLFQGYLTRLGKCVNEFARWLHNLVMHNTLTLKINIVFGNSGPSQAQASINAQKSLILKSCCLF